MRRRAEGRPPVRTSGDLASERSQQGGKKRHGADDREGDGDASGDGHAGEEACVEDQHAQEGDDHGSAGEEDGPAGGVHGQADRRRDVRAGSQCLAVAADDDEGVVDSDSEADERRELRGNARDGHRVGQQHDHQ